MGKKVLILGIGLMSFSAFAYEGIISQSGTCGATDADCHYNLYSDGHLEIRGNGEMNDYTHVYGDNPAPWGTEITSIEISGITSVGRLAFHNAQATEVKIGDSVETLKDGAFQHMPLLHSVEFSENSNLASINTAVFGENPMLNHFELPQSLSYLGHYNFYGNTAVETLVLPDSLFEDGAIGLEISALTNIGQIFCSKENENKCKEYLKTAKQFNASNFSFEPLGDVKLEIYEANQSGYLYDGKFYNDPNDILSRNYIKKRIYTIGEANAVTKPTGNTIKIKYR